jgi:hypothetical protein
MLCVGTHSEAEDMPNLSTKHMYVKTADFFEQILYYFRPMHFHAEYGNEVV